MAQLCSNASAASLFGFEVFAKRAAGLQNGWSKKAARRCTASVTVQLQAWTARHPATESALTSGERELGLEGQTSLLESVPPAVAGGVLISRVLLIFNPDD